MELLAIIKESLEKVKATNVIAYDLRGISPLADYTVIATIDVARQANACIDYILEHAKTDNIRCKNIEGRNSTWILIDLYDVIVHIFTKEERDHYQLERLYAEIPQIDFNNLK